MTTSTTQQQAASSSSAGSNFDLTHYKHTPFSKSAELVLMLDNLHYHCKTTPLTLALNTAGLKVDKLKLLYSGGNGWTGTAKVLLLPPPQGVDTETYVQSEMKKLSGLVLEGQEVGCRRASEATDLKILMEKRSKSSIQQIEMTKMHRNRMQDIISQKKAEHMYIIDFEVACSDATQYFPVEVGVSKVKFDDSSFAVVDQFHCFIDPGRLPPTLQKTAAYTEERVHGIPIQNFKEAESDYSKIWSNLLKFLQVPEHVTTIPDNLILLAKAPAAENGCIHFLKQKANETKMGLLHNAVADLTDFLYCLNNSLSPEQLLKAIASHIVSKFNEEKNRCEYHQGLSRRFHCALEDTCSIALYLKKLVESNYAMLSEEEEQETAVTEAATVEQQPPTTTTVTITSEQVEVIKEEWRNGASNGEFWDI